MEAIKTTLEKLLTGKEPGKNQLVELPVPLVRAALTGKPVGEAKDQEALLAGVSGLRDHEKVFQSADQWLLIAKEL